VKAAESSEKKVKRKYFLLINEANCQLLEVQNGSARPGAKLVIDKKKHDKPPQQRWYCDESGVIRSGVNEYALESKDGGDKVCLMPYSGDARQQWILKDNRIINKLLASDCVALKKRLFLSDDADVIVTRYEGKAYQHWRVEFI